MHIDVIPYASAIRDDLVYNRSVVVIDVLRASSVMVTAFNNGARAFIPVETVEKAKELAAGLDKADILLAGERDTRKIEGFHLGNSPFEYTAEKVSGKKIILTTSNGTKALHKIKDAREVLIGSFLNAGAVARALHGKKNIALVCSGTNNTFSMDDGMCAAMITDLLTKNSNAVLSDFTLTLLKAYRTGKENLRTLLNGCYHLNLLIKNGFEKDVNYCLQTGKYSIVPRFEAGAVVLK